jgi:hypothetical protein
VRVPAARTLILAVAGALLLAACGGDGLIGDIDLGTIAAINARTGQPADYTAFLLNRTGATVTLRSARLVGVPGFRTPQLAHLAIERGRAIIGAATGYPPHATLAPFAGDRLADGDRAQILYAVRARSPGGYAVKGIDLTVISGGQRTTVFAYSAAATCVSAGRPHGNCVDALGPRLRQAVAKVP